MRVHLRHSRARKLSCAVSRNKIARAAARHSKKSCVPGPRGGAPLLQLWLHTPSCSDLVWIPGSGFGSVSVSMTTKPCLNHACYLAATSGFIHDTPPYGFNLSWSPRPNFSLAHATPGFQLHSPLLCFHLIHATFRKSPASGSGYRLPTSQFQYWVCWTHFLYEMMEIQSFLSGSRRREVQPLKAQALNSDLNSNLNCVTVNKLPNLSKLQFPNLFKDDKYT